ncbi:MAG: hypothetical protein IPJ69_03640 [Deltaproteobacteria bacterium]|nr:MAG: hypothetical protein IPJ69_03640 [Deltaproteobacteria bacterium]
MKQYILILFLLFSPSSLWAYNFLYINPTSREPIGWEPGTTIHYYVDPGPLGLLTNEQARALIRAAMDIWEDTSPYANVPHFQYEGLLAEDVNSSNYQDFVSRGTCFTSSISSCPSQAQRDIKTVIIFDNDGTILNRELCSLTGCGAYGDAQVFSGDVSNPGYIVSGTVVLGTFVASDLSTINNSLGTIVHELGHMLGLAHPALNQQFYSDPTKSTLIPTMELSSAPGIADFSGNNTSSLNPDDIDGMIQLYPSSTSSSHMGVISGEIFKSDGTPMMYANVIARNEDDPFCEAYSMLSGRICPLGSHSLTLNMSSCFDNMGGGIVESGKFNILVPPGTYTLEVEEITNQTLASVVAPGLVEPFLYGDAEFWNLEDSATEDSSVKSSISVTAGETKENINITLNRSSVIADRIKYISYTTTDSITTTHCQSNPTDYATVLGLSNSAPSAGGCSLIH